MTSNIVHVHFKEAKTQPAKNPTAPAPGTYAREASDLATDYLAQLAREDRERLAIPEILFEGAAEPQGQCPHCESAYQTRSKKWVLLKCSRLRVHQDSQRLEIQCRTCKRWVEWPAHV